MRTLTVFTLCLAIASRAFAFQAGSLLLDGFEDETALEKWSLTEVQAQISSSHTTQGSKSAILYFSERQPGGPWPTALLRLDRDVLPGNDWIAYQRLLFDVANTSDQVIELRAGLRDSTGRVASGTFSIGPHSSTTCEIPVEHVYKKVQPVYMGRGEKHVRDIVRILDFYVLLIAEDSICLDNVRLVADELEIESTALLDDPFGLGRVTVSCELNRAAQCDVKVFDSSDRLVARHVERTDRLDWRWEDRDELSTMLPGIYRVKLAATDVKWAPDSPLKRELGAFQIIPEQSAPEIVAWYEPSTRKVMLHSRPENPGMVIRWEQIKSGSREIEPLRIEMARNEYEGAQVVFLSRSETARVSFELEALKNEKSGTAFPLEGSSICQVGYLKTEDPVYYEVDFLGWWPDALLHTEQMYVHPGECMPVWINLKTAKNTPAGLYRLRLAVWKNGERAGYLPLEVRVYDAVIPTETTIRTAFTFSDDLVSEIHGGKLPDGMLRKYHQFLADHRLNVDNIYRSAPPDLEIVEYFHSKGQLNAFNLKYIGGRIDAKDRIDNERYLQSLAETFDPYVENLREKGLVDKAYFYGFDEIGGEMYDVVKRVYRFLKKRYPEIPTMTTGRDASFGIDSGLEEEVDIWVPLTPVYDLERAELTRKRGKEVWWYICISPPHPYANWFVEYPAIEPRLLWWMTYQQKVPGFLYYFTNLRHGQEELMRVDGHNKANWNPASWRTANGDGCFIYSGPDGPISTIRFENIRDGIEDTELLFLLEKKLGDSGSASRAFCDELIKSLTDYTRNVKKFASVRKMLLERLEEF